jgi:ribonuclease BN (tRNA processing enzyme)
MNSRIFSVDFVGTGGVHPSFFNRELPFMVLKMMDKVIFLDMGEGSQKKLFERYKKIIIPDYIFVSHYHLDHCYGIIPFLKTLDLLNHPKEITLLLPSYLHNNFYNFLEKELPTKLNLKIIFGENSFSENGLNFSFFKTNHNVESRGIKILMDERRKYNLMKIKNLSGIELSKIKNEGQITKEGITYKYGQLTDIVEPEKSIIYTGDTRPMLNKLPISDYLIHESTYVEGEEKVAVLKKHTCFTELLRDKEQYRKYSKVFLVHLHPKIKNLPTDNFFKFPSTCEFIDLTN